MWRRSHSGGEENSKTKDHKQTMTSTVQKHIAEVQAEAARLTSLLEIYPDLTFETNRWRRTFQCSRAVNECATDYEIAYSCGCCPDPALYVRVFVETQHGRVYGSPHQIEIGERDGIDCPIDGWDCYLHSHGIQGSIIERLKVRFANQQYEEQDQEVEDEALRCCAS